MRKSAAAFIHFLARQCADPTKAAKAMLNSGEKHVRLTKKQITFNTLDRLVNKGLGTEDVEQGSTRLIKNRGKRDQGYIDYVMKRRRRDAYEKLEKARRVHCGSLKYLVSIVPNQVMDEF